MTSNARKLAIATALVMTATVIAAQLAIVYRTARRALAAVVLAGLGPPAAAVGALALLAVGAMVVALVGGERGTGGAAVERLAAAHARLAARLQRPAAWGAALGLVAGTAVVWATIAALVAPKEGHTLQELRRAQAAVEQRRAREGAYPAALGSGNGNLPLDGFGRPLWYETHGGPTPAAYIIGSLGFDGRPSADDICVTGPARTAPIEALGFREGMAAVRAARCPPAR
jgi:hypothetical protein